LVKFLQENLVPSLFSPVGVLHSAHQVLGAMGLTDENGQSRKCNHVPATIMRKALKCSLMRRESLCHF
jgi:hypothetical protein